MTALNLNLALALALNLAPRPFDSDREQGWDYKTLLNIFSAYSISSDVR